MHDQTSHHQPEHQFNSKLICIFAQLQQCSSRIADPDRADREATTGATALCTVGPDRHRHGAALQ